MSSGSLARTAVALRLALLRGSLRAGPGATRRRVGLLLGALFGLAGSALAVLGLAAARGHGTLPADLAVLLYNLLLLGWIVLPVLTFGSDDLLDPARLALLPLTGRQLVTVLGVSSLIGIAPASTLVLASGVLPATAHGLRSTVVGLLAVPLLLALCVTASRACLSVLSVLLRSRRARDLGIFLVALVGLSFQLANVGFQALLRRGDHGAGAAHEPARWLAWTPAGLLAAAPTRSWPVALGSLAGVVLLLAGLLVAWQRAVRRATERADLSGASRRRRPRRRALPLPSRWTGGRVAALAAKDLRYLARDPRRIVGLIYAALLPLIFLAPVLVDGGGLPRRAALVVIGVAVIGNPSAANRFGFTGSANWMLIGSWTRPGDPRRDLLGGDLASALVLGPVILLEGLLLAAVSGGWGCLAAAYGTAFSVLAIGLGVTGLTAVTTPYAVAETANAFGGGGAGQGSAAIGTALASFFGQLALMLPLLGLLIPALVTASPVFDGLLLVLGPVYGLAVGAGFRTLAARRWERSGPEILQTVAR